MRSRRLIVLLGGVLSASIVSAAVPTPQAHPLSQKRSGKRRRSRVPVFSGRLATEGELRSEPLDRPSGHLSIYAVNFRESVDVDLYESDGSFNEEALDQLNHLFRCRRTGTEKSINPHLFEMLSRIYDHFGQRLDLVSGFRNQSHVSSFHFHGSASDIRIPGLPIKELHDFVRTLDIGGMGIGIYPKANFIHVDIRPEPSFRWVDYSPPGSKEMGRPHHKKSKKSRAGFAANS